MPHRQHHHRLTRKPTKQTPRQTGRQQPLLRRFFVNRGNHVNVRNKPIRMIPNGATTLPMRHHNLKQGEPSGDVNSNYGAVAQWESACFASRKSRVRIPSAPPSLRAPSNSGDAFRSDPQLLSQVPNLTPSSIRQRDAEMRVSYS